MENKLALVTGATGFVGSHLVDLLLEKKYSVRVITRKNSDLKWLKGKNIHINVCDFNVKEQLEEAVRGCSYIFHVGGVIKAKTKEEYFSGNQGVTKNLIEAVKKSNPGLEKFIFVGTQASAGPSPSERPISEDEECKPITSYGKSKLEAEKVVIAEKDNLPVVVCRPSVVYGPRDPEVMLFFKTIKSGVHPLVGFNEKYVSIIHVSDLVRGILGAAEAKNSNGRIYFLSSDKYYGWNELGQIAAKHLNKKTLKLRIPESMIFIVAAVSEFLSRFKKEATILNLEKANEMVQNFWTCSNIRAKTDFNFNPVIDIDEGFRTTIEWYKKEKWI